MKYVIITAKHHDGFAMYPSAVTRYNIRDATKFPRDPVLKSQTNVLRVFDGDLHGKKLHFGDGKAPRAYVLDWSEPNEWVGWKVRLNEPARYEISVKYTTASAANTGAYTISFGDQVIPVSVVPTPGEPQATTTTIGMVSLVPGEYEIQVKPSDIRGGELMRLFNISLTPK